mgnify:CR=1 FL=1
MRVYKHKTMNHTIKIIGEGTGFLVYNVEKDGVFSKESYRMLTEDLVNYE